MSAHLEQRHMLPRVANMDEHKSNLWSRGSSLPLANLLFFLSSSSLLSSTTYQELGSIRTTNPSAVDRGCWGDMISSDLKRIP
jgi:hypothetical protein